MIKTGYGPHADALAMQFGPEGAHRESDGVAPGAILGFDAHGTVIAVEVPDVRMRAAAQSPVQDNRAAATQ